MVKNIPDFTVLLTKRSVAKKYIRFHYTFSHDGLWLKSIPDFRILFSHGCLWQKSISDFTILLATAVYG
jgi:hypothetical protein